MNRRWPNTKHWQDTWEALDRIAGSRKRRYGEELFGLPRGGLRAYIDRHDITHEELVRIEDLIAAAFRAVMEDWRRGLEEIERDARVFDGKSAVRRFEVRTAEIQDCNDYAEAFANQWCEDNVIGWKKEAA
ncbi:hypothetical protein [Bradyrhizobium ottawaense]|uniref:hypothetical protein n=1 Tax=Bradyrhizobium ottawaense TaxID=931866 RepID=UPI0038381B31